MGASPEYLAAVGVVTADEAIPKRRFINTSTAAGHAQLADAGERIIGVSREAAAASGEQIEYAKPPSAVLVAFAAAATREDAGGNPTRIAVAANGKATPEPATGTGSLTLVGEMDPGSDEPASDGDIGLVRLYQAAVTITLSES